jgi:hypothetical protein
MEHAYDLDIGSHAVDHHERRAGNHQFARERHPSRSAHRGVFRQSFDGIADAPENAKSGGRIVLRDAIGLFV